jgi:transcriptional regulator with XRE-family HTH domain
MDISNILNQLNKAGLTQAQIAAEIGCSQPTVSDMQAGKLGRKRPSYDLVVAIARVAEKYGVSIEDQPEQVQS